MSKTFTEIKKSEEKDREVKKNKRRAYWLPFKNYWLLYVALIGTAVLSAFAGIYIGLAPDAAGKISYTSTFDLLRRAFFALFYVIGFVATAEGATLYWENKLVYHDVNADGKSDPTQVRTARVALVVSVLTIILTGLASARFLTTWLGSLTAFETVPVAAQEYVVWSIPILLVFHVVASILYWYNSEEARLDRWMSEIQRQTRASAHQIKANAWKNVYTGTAPELARKQGIALAQKALKQDFYEQEVASGTDLDGDGEIGPPQLALHQPTKFYDKPTMAPGFENQDIPKFFPKAEAPPSDIDPDIDPDVDKWVGDGETDENTPEPSF